MWGFLESWSGFLFWAALAMSVAGILLVTIVIIRLPVDQFTNRHPKPKYRHPVLHCLYVLIKNLTGAALVILGIVMVITPGPGIISILLGVSISDIPGKHEFVHGCLKMRSVRRSLNWMRRKAGQPPLEFPEIAES